MLQAIEQNNTDDKSKRSFRTLIVVAGIIGSAPFVAAGIAIAAKVTGLPPELGWFIPVALLESALLAYGFGVGIVGLVASALSSTEHAREASAAVIILGCFFMALGPAAKRFAMDILTDGKASPLPFLVPVALFVWAASLLTDAHRKANHKPQ